jgi:hypothetical protein
VAASKQRIGVLKASLQQRRLARSMAALLRQQQGGSGEDAGEAARLDAEEREAKATIEQACWGGIACLGCCVLEGKPSRTGFPSGGGC